MKKDSTVNTFQDGLIMDLNPLLTPNSALTNCLNGTIVTFNGNENVLQNDMGNGRVETAYLPQGYVPLGTAELGGIIYIVSYNPLKDKCQIGCFPSPERNITSDKITPVQSIVDNSSFRNIKTNEITTTEYKLELLGDTKLYPGDKYSIYSTNNGIKNNLNNLSFIGVDHKIPNEIYKNVEIHVICISDDGKITYLDDSVKWFENTISNQSYDYYIRDVEKQGDVQDDIDNYRTLVQSAYNIFNSKTSGKLALLFKLNVINTFSTTWELESMEDVSGKKEVKLAFDINYTSDHKDINPTTIISNFEITNNSNIEVKDKNNNIIKLNDIKELPIFNTNDDGNIVDDIKRKNDGNDETIKIPIGTYKTKKDENYVSFIYDPKESPSFKYDLTPAMKFGILKFLNQHGTIELSKIGTNTFDIQQWKYFVVPGKSITINLGIGAYPKLGDSVDEVKVIFYDINNLDSLEQLKTSKEYIDNVKRYTEKSITSKIGYSGNYQLQQYIGTNIKGDCLYLIDICIKVKTKQNKYEYHHNIRFLYTSTIFNKKYYSDISDFNTLEISEYLEPLSNIEIHSNTLNNTTTILPKPEPLFDNINNEAYAYGTMSAQTTKVNGSIEFNPSTIDKNCENLIKYSLNNYKIGDIKITYQNDTPIADTEQDNNTNLVKHITEKPETENTNLDGIISDENQNKQYYDHFTCNIRDNRFIDVTGKIYSRINAKLEEKEIKSNKQLRPVLYNTDDLDSLGLKLNNNIIDFRYVFVMESNDWGKGDDYRLDMWQYDTSSFGPLTNEYANDNTQFNKLQFYQTGRNDFGGDGSFTRNWSEVKVFKDSIIPLMNNTGNLFTCWQFGWRTGKRTERKWRFSNNTNLENKLINRPKKDNEWYAYVIMVKTDNGFMPMSPFLTYNSSMSYKNTINYFSGIMTALYTQLYYVYENDITIKKPRVTNINYITDYNVILNIPITFDINKISVNTPNGYYELPNNDSENKYPNIQYNKIKNSSGNIVHNFFIQNNELYDTYSLYKDTTAQCIALTPQGRFTINANRTNTLYVPEDSNHINYGFKNLKSVTRLLISPYVTVDDNNVIYMNNTDKIYLQPDFLKYLEISDGKLFVKGIKNLVDMQTTEYSKKSTEFNITFKGNTSSFLYLSR